ncbi:hypothetical protein ACE1MS_23430 (plasmid) [Lysinibacillus sp. fkY74-1]
MDLTRDEQDLLLLLHYERKNAFDPIEFKEKFASLIDKGYICNIISTPTGGYTFNISAKGIDLIAELQNK